MIRVFLLALMLTLTSLVSPIRAGEQYSRIAELVLNIRSTEAHLFKELGIRMDGYSGAASLAQDGAYQALMRKIELEARSRRYQARDASERYYVVLAKAPGKNFHVNESSMTISVANSDEAVSDLFAYFERLPSTRTLSKPALVERIAAFIQEGESLRLEVRPSEGQTPLDLRIEAYGSDRWIILP